ncbi:MAG: N-6 DNA methylase [bacterium]|nr:N-6 DNA methylase [bacterium]
MSTVGQLKEIWKKEKEHYLSSEVGSGVQRFVYSLLSSPDIFGLKEGYKATKQEKRSNEFLREESNKAGLADAVIFINQDIVIPVEVEKLSQIKSGEWQIHKYRTAFDKKYGILTDGNEWRFYYGDIGDQKYYKFMLNEIFDDTKRFLIFWNQYIQPTSYYLSFFEEIGQQKLLFAEELIEVDHNRQRFFEDVTQIIKKLKAKLLNAGYFKEIEDERKKEKMATETAYSYLIQFILYKTLVDNAFSEFKDEFKKKEKLIHTHLKNGAYNSILMILEGMSSKISENIYKPFHKEQESIIKEVHDLLHSGEDNLMSMSPFLDIFVFIKRYEFANIQNDIFGAIYENYLKELFEEKNYGQYFTAPEVVNFMLREVGYTSNEIEKRGHKNISIADPSCGSGTFLYSAVREIMKAGDYGTEAGSREIEEEINGNVFGLDIEEFPLYLAEMSVLMRMLPAVVTEKYNNPIDKKLKFFVTEDSIAEFLGEIGGRKANGGGDGQSRLALQWKYDGFMRDERDLDEMKQSLSTLGSGTKTIPRRRFDFIVGNPPYISYNESSKMGIKFFRLLKEKNSGASLNDIYGWNLHSVPNNRKKYAPKPNLYTFFIALGFALLKPGGRFSYIVPQTLLSGGDLDVIRYHLANEYTIEKLITFAGNLFIGRGTNQKKKIPTSSLVLVCRKEKPNKSHEVECIHFPEIEWEAEKIFDELQKNRSHYSRNVPQTTLRRDFGNWNFIKWNEKLIKLYDKYKEHSESMEVYYSHEEAEKRFGERFYFDGGADFEESAIVNTSQKDSFEFFDYRMNDWNNFVLSKSHYWVPKNTKLSFPQGSQGKTVFDQKYKIIWRTKFANRFQFCERGILLQGNQSLLISTNHERESLFLFSILNSKLILKLLEKLFRNENEKDYILAIKTIKAFVRPPIINTLEKKELKDRIISLASEIVQMEKITVGNVVEIDTLTQQFESAFVEGSVLVLLTADITLRFQIKKGFEKVVKKAVENAFGVKTLPIQSVGILLSRIKELPAFDHTRQAEIRSEMDNIVTDLYELTEAEKSFLDTNTP